MMNNIRNILKLKMIRGVSYAGFMGTPNEGPVCLNPKPIMFLTRIDDMEFSVNLLNFPTALGGEAKKY
mgnify:CR=1 FL=1